MRYQTTFVNVVDSINALAASPLYDRIAVAGRNVLKIYSAPSDVCNEFKEVSNLRVGKNMNLNFSSTDIAWCQNDANILATGSTNGNVVVWNLSRVGKQKQDRVLEKHERTVYKVDFSNIDPKLLLTGAHDAIAIFDLRQQAVVHYCPKDGHLRHVGFIPNEQYQFSAGIENHVEIWDMRYTQRHVLMFTAHLGPVLSCDWNPNPQFSKYLATGGRDNVIKIWNLEYGPANLLTTIPTIDSVSFLQWRPRRPYHLASCSLLQDFSINVWDFRRPYLPFLSFNEHTQPPTGLVWRDEGECDVLYSGAKNGNLYQHIFQDALRCEKHLPLVALGLASSGRLIQTSRAIVSSRYPTTTPQSYKIQEPISFKKPNQETSDVKQVFSKISHFYANGFEIENIKNLANKYELRGRSTSELCEKNGEHAKAEKANSAAQLWFFLHKLYSPYIPPEECDQAKRKLSIADSVNSDDSSNESDDISYDFTIPIDSLKAQDPNSPIASKLLNSRKSDFYVFSDFTTSDVFDSSDYYNQSTTSYEISSDKQNFRHDLSITALNTIHEPKPEETTVNYELANHIVTYDIDNSPPLPSTVDLILQMLITTVEEGDLQLGVTVLLVLKDEIQPSQYGPIEDRVEEWFHSYIDILTSLNLYVKAAEIIKLAPLPAINALNQQSTLFCTKCFNCRVPLIEWQCSNCSFPSSCFVCRHPVKGRYVWCQGCCHGGHIEHLAQWFKNHKQCPSGCGHNCEFF